MAVLNGKYSFPPNETNYSLGFKEIIKRCLNVKPEARPDIDEVSRYPFRDREALLADPFRDLGDTTDRDGPFATAMSPYLSEKFDLRLVLNPV